MKRLLLSILSGLMLCQCESVPRSSLASGPALTESGLTRWERTEAARGSRPMSLDRADPMNKVQAREGAVGYRLMEF